MQVKGRLTEILLALCCIFLIVMSVLCFQQTKKLASCKEANIILRANSDTFHKVLKRNQKAVLLSDYALVREDAGIVYVNDGKLDSVCSTRIKNKIVLFVPAHTCNVCYDEIYDALKYAQDSLSVAPLVVTEREKYNEVRNIISDLGFHLDIFYIKDSDFWKEVSIIYAPFLSYVDDELRCRHCFVPLPNHPEYSFGYLDFLSERYFKLK